MILRHINTPNFVLRTCATSDAPKLVRLLDPEIGDRLGSWPYPQTIDEVELRIAHHLVEAAKGLCSPFVAVDKATGRTMGWVNIAWRTRPANCAQFSMWIGKSFQNYGIATELGFYATSACFENTQIDCVRAATLPDNTQVVGLARNWGMQRDGFEEHLIEGRGHFVKCLAWRLSRLEWVTRVEAGEWPRAL